jgi:hypothetical protein
VTLVVDTPVLTEREQGLADRVRQRAEDAARTLIAGSPVGAVRRIVLYVIVGLTLLTEPTPFAAVSLVAWVLLIATDVLR